MQAFIAGLSSSARKLCKGQARAFAEVRAAIIMQRQGLTNLKRFDPDGLSAAAREIMQHNMQFSQEEVICAHQAMLVGP